MGDNRTWSKFLVSVAILEIIIAAIAASGLGVNTLATTHGTADVILKLTDTKIDTFSADLVLEITKYHITGTQDNSGESETASYTYKQAYNDACGSDAPDSNATMNCNLRYAVWQWTSAFTTLGTIACVLVFVAGVSLLILTCCGENIRHCLCGNDGTECKCCRCLLSCTVELMLIALNVLVFILFSFSWAIIIGLKYANLDSTIEGAAEEALNNQSDEVRYENLDVEPLKAGDSLWPLAVASFLSLVVAFYVFISWCCRCCSGDDDHTQKNLSANNNRKNSGDTEMV